MDGRSLILFRITTQRLEQVVTLYTHPEIDVNLYIKLDKNAVAAANTKYSELLQEQESSGILTQLLLYKSNLTKGQDEATSYPSKHPA